MKRFGIFLMVAVLILGIAGLLGAETTLEKIKRTGVFTVGARTSSPPFGYINKQNEWGGFSIDLARLVNGALEKKLGQQIKFELKESTPATRIPLLTSMAVDLIAGTMTITRARRESVDFSLIFFGTGAQFLVKKGSPIKSIKDIDGKRIGAQQGSTNEKFVRENYPKATLVVYQDQAAGNTALMQGKIDAYTNDGIQLWGLKNKAEKPDNWNVVGEWYTYDPYGMAMRINEADFRLVVDSALMDAIEGGEYYKIYDKWFGPKSENPFPLSPEARALLIRQVIPK
jgi:polar amino acid transport system substrate-binding protein